MMNELYWKIDSDPPRMIVLETFGKSEFLSIIKQFSAADMSGVENSLIPQSKILYRSHEYIYEFELGMGSSMDAYRGDIMIKENSAIKLSRVLIEDQKFKMIDPYINNIKQYTISITKGMDEYYYVTHELHRNVANRCYYIIPGYSILSHTDMHTLLGSPSFKCDQIEGLILCLKYLDRLFTYAI